MGKLAAGAKIVSTAAAVAGAGVQARAADLSAYLAPMIADVNATNYDNAADWLDFSARLDQQTTRRKTEIMRDLGKLESRAMDVQAVYAKRQAYAEAEALDRQADAVDRFGAEDRVRMETESHRAIASIESRYAKSGVVGNSGSAVKVTAEAQARAELDEQDQLRRITGEVQRLRHAGAVKRWEGDVSSALIGYSAQRMRYSIGTDIHQELLQGEVRQMDYSNKARGLRTKALMARVSGDMQADAYEAQGSAARLQGAASVAGGAFDIYDLGYELGKW